MVKIGISPRARLALAIRFLATGETFRSLSFQFCISRAAISYIVDEVCNAIIKNVGLLSLKFPETAAEWEAIASEFEEQWNYPNCVGAIGGEHLVMQQPPNSGSKFSNYKNTHSVDLLAVAGPHYNCIYADVGTNGRISDGRVWAK